MQLMKHLLFPLLAVLALPTAVIAENYYLLVGTKGYRNWTVPMESIEECEKSLTRVIKKSNWEGDTRGNLVAICVKGK